MPHRHIIETIEHASLGKNVIIYDNPGAGLQSWDRALQDFDSVLVSSVMRDPAEEIDIGVVHGLSGEEVVRLECDAVL